MIKVTCSHDVVRQPSCANAALVGGKAAALSRLVGEGFPIPPFVVLTSFENLDPSKDESLAASIASCLDGPYAVRSSAGAEDGAAVSFAGQFLTVLDVQIDRLGPAIREVRKSGPLAGVAGYLKAMKSGADGSVPSVIVQRMVRARAAGVAFSVDPVTGRSDRVVVSATRGLGDKLVGGEVDGDTWTLDRETGAVLKGRGDSLSPRDLAEVHGLVGSLRRLASGPLDVEWAFDGERLWLLQARPVTTRTLPLPVRDSATGVYDNSNIVESYPGVVSPLTFSFAQYAYSRVYAAFVRLLGVPAERVAAHRPVFDNMLARVHGRAYYRLDNWRRALMLLPGYGLNSGYMDAMMGLDEPFPDGVVETPPRPRGMALAAEILGVAKGAAGMVLAAVRLPSMRDAFLARLESVMAESGDRVETASLVRLAAVYRSVEARLLDRWDAPLVNDFLCMVAFGASRRIAESWLGPAGLELHNACMIGQGDIVSAEPVRRIAQMAVLVRGDPALVAALDRGDEDAILGNPSLATCLKAYVEKFGDRSPGELKLESPTLADDPSSLYRAVAGAARRAPPDEGAPVIVRYALGSLLPRSPVKRLLLGTLLGYAKARVRDRENLRFERTRVFGLARRVFRAMGAQFHALGLLDDPRDVFLLTVGECLGAVEGGGVDFDLRSLAALRRAEAAGYPPENPPTRFMVRGALAASIDVVVPAEAEIDSDPGGPVRKGFACSDGRVVGVARVVEDPRTQRIGDGEILVARSTDPGWIALFANAGAVVVERGSPLSHSAIVSRELGIPCVVAVKNATRWIADGDRIAVDGRAGTVEKLPAKESANG